MKKTARRSRRRRIRSRAIPRAEAASERKGESPVHRDPPAGNRLLDRLLGAPDLARVVPRLQPEVLHRVIQTCGLEDCGELVALATPNQLAGILDLDLWRPPRAGVDEELDAHRFGTWLEVFLELGSAVAAEKLAGVDAELVIAALAQHVRVFDLAAVLAPASTDDEEPIERRGRSEGSSCEVGGYLVEARRTDAWDAIVAVLGALGDEHADYFHHVMRGCRRLSNSKPEIDGLDDLLTDGEQDLFDLTLEREERREQQGYATPSQARAFLQMSRELDLHRTGPPPENPIVRAYFGAIRSAPPADANGGAATEAGAHEEESVTREPPVAPEDTDAAIAAVAELLREAGVLGQPPRALLEAPQEQAPRFARMQAHMQLARDLDHTAYPVRTEELAYLVNALAAGCAVQARPIEPREASDAAVAVCNLGLENWPSQWRAEGARHDAQDADASRALPEDFLVHQHLVAVFQVGWTVLYRDVAMYAAERLTSVLENLRLRDREIQADLDALRIAMMKHGRAGSPWLAREALDAVMMLDMPAWAALRGLIDEFPVLHAAVAGEGGSGARALTVSQFEWISENRQIAAIHRFLESLPEALGP